MTTINIGDSLPVLDHGYVSLVAHMGTDASVVEAARMSTGKGFLGWGPKPDGSAGDEKLLAYLYEHQHHTPFEMVQLVIEAQAPVFVLRQWHRHRVPFSYNEHSGRYAEMPDLFYVPATERVRGKDVANKQGSGAALPFDDTEAFVADVRRALKAAKAGGDT